MAIAMVIKLNHLKVIQTSQKDSMSIILKRWFVFHFNFNLLSQLSNKTHNQHTLWNQKSFSMYSVLYQSAAALTIPPPHHRLHTYMLRAQQTVNLTENLNTVHIFITVCPSYQASFFNAKFTDICFCRVVKGPRASSAYN